jgi:light-regulated signal transduction histidine kinase (bacteriophytochrome)
MTPQEQQLHDELIAFGYAVSHDLRAPLRAIAGFGQALTEDYRQKLDEEGAKYLDHICSAAARMNNMIDGLLELSRVSRADMREERVDITSIAESIATELQAADPSRNVQFSIASGLTVTGDPALLGIALRHLLSNAWKFTSRHARAHIEVGRAERRGRSVIFVRDDGAGFDGTFVDKLFTPLQRLHTASEFDGIGAGLAVVQRIVRRHGGTVEAEGAVERGATIYIDIT